MRWVGVIFALAVILVAVSAATATVEQASASLPLDAQDGWNDATARMRVEPALLRQMISTPAQERQSIIVVMRQQAEPTSGLDLAGAARDQKIAERTGLVEMLRATAAFGQKDVLAFLAQEQSAGRAEAVRSFWIFNGLAAQASPQTIRSLALRSDVELVQLDRYEYRLDSDSESKTSNSRFKISNSVIQLAFQPGEPRELAGVEWGVQRVQANKVWAAFNNTGAGVVVANADTGVDYMHPALNANYRGNVGKDLYQHTGNWFDATGAGALYPVDGNGHGTHTMGTLAGREGIGVAPGAQWMAVRVLDSMGYGYNSWIHAAFEWIMAPAGNPALAPDVLSNSWGNPYGSSTEFELDLTRLRQAGILTVFSAGNSGPEAGTIGSPGSLRNAFAVGATDVDNAVTWFSSRGPSPWDEIKPEIVAPGVNVRSSLPGGAYGLGDGTSMAAPHVAGVAALMLAANPTLTVSAVEQTLIDTAVPISLPVPNNDTGWGLVDAYAAVQAVVGAGELSGTVIDAASRLAIQGASATIYHYDTGHWVSAQTGADGQYSAALVSGMYSVTASMFGYLPSTASPALVITGQVTTRDLELAPLPVGVLRGVLTDTVSGQALTVTVSVLSTPLSQTAFGLYHFDLPVGDYIVEARKTGYRVVTATVTITAGQVTQLDFGLDPTWRILLVNSGAWYYREYPQYFRQALDELHYAYDERRIKKMPGDIPTADDLLKYNLVIWSSPEDSPGYLGLSGVITQYLSSGGDLVLTGQDIAFWDGGGTPFFYSPYLSQYLKTVYIKDDSEIDDISGLAGAPMEGMDFRIAGGDGADNQRWPDVIAVADADHAAQVLAYQGDGSAGQVVGLCLPYRGVVLPFGYEAISDAAKRQELLRRALDYFDSPRQTQGLDLAATSPTSQVGKAGTVISFTARVRNSAELGLPLAYTTSLRSAAWTASVSPTQFVLSPCATIPLTIHVNIPAGLERDVYNPITLTVHPLALPTLSRVITFTAKTPAPVLLVDDDRWHNVESAYTQSLDKIGVSYDVWQVKWSGTMVELNGPPAARLGWYPVVVWFTGYDWYLPLAAYDEEQLASFLDQGGRLMLSSAFYLDLRSDNDFAHSRLGVMDYTYHLSSTYSYGSPGHPLGAGLAPSDLVDPFPTSAFYTLDYVLVPTASAQTAWRGDYDRAQAIARSQPGNRLIFWGIPFEALNDEARAAALRRSVGWLGPLGDSGVQVDPAVISVGQAAAVTLTAQNNLADTTAAFTVTLPVSVTPVLSTLPPGVVYDSISNTLAWSGPLGAGAARVFAFRVTATGDISALGNVIFRDTKLGIDFDQPLPLRVGAPNLQLSTLQAPSGRSGMPATIAMQARNGGPGLAPSAVVTGLAPLGIEIISGSVEVDGPGSALAQADRIVWHGALESGQLVTVTYQITAPLTSRNLSLPIEMLASDGSLGAWEWRKWMVVCPMLVYLPLVMK